MKCLNLNIYKVQMAYFFREKSDIKAFGLTSSLYKQLKTVFRTEPQTLPIPDDAPAEVPRCMWNDINTNMTFNKVRLDFTFNIPTKYNWENLLNDFNKRIMEALEEAEVVIDRVGLVVEVMSLDRLHDLLKEYIQLEKFNSAKEANISWLETNGSFNVWTYFQINEFKDENKIIFDVNSLPECKLSEQGIYGKDAMARCAEILKGKIINVL